ncbi:LacI family DNA-binding transcriptional regulator [Microbacterium sp. GCS4]|uniref:LacI family DNA-binding transcriptional regulator n=1 Tax=Microbacterium sp. GCS4 TaxID=1692239 RepID=UPI00068291FD|nr:LacI family DNA-binding transcriptional regulator [Microbacterium sp. GCS4]
MPHHRSTQADVAALAGVSQATVSIVLSGHTPKGVRISEATRNRVQEALRITGYSANPVAQRLAGGKNQLLGVFTYEKTFPRGGRDFYGAFLNGIEEAAEQLGVDMLLFTSARVVDGRRRLAGDGWQRLGIADGCLLLGQQEDREELQHLLDTNYPFVFIGKRETDKHLLPYVGADYVTATARQIDRLVALGHTQIAYAGLRGDDQSTRDRVDGYRDAMTAKGLAPRFLDLREPARGVGEVVERGITALLLAPENDPDEIADAIEARGLAVPRDISIVLLGQPHLPLRRGRRWSGFSVPREEMGARALVLLSRIVHQDAEPARRSSARSSTALQLTDADYHQLIDCPDVDGDTLALAPALTRPFERNPS